jgi:hypothetical protein
MAGILEVRRLMPGYMRLEGDGDEEIKSEIGNIEDYVSVAKAIVV